MDESARALVSGLLDPEPQERLGGSRVRAEVGIVECWQGAQEVKEHAFFHGVDWELLLLERTEAPFVPEVRL